MPPNGIEPPTFRLLSDCCKDKEFCPVCKEAVEDYTHHFVQCKDIAQSWATLSEWMRPFVTSSGPLISSIRDVAMPSLGDNIREQWHALDVVGMLWRTLVALTCHQQYEYRNSSTFDNVRIHAFERRLLRVATAAEAHIRLWRRIWRKNQAAATMLGRVLVELRRRSSFFTKAKTRSRDG